MRARKTPKEDRTLLWVHKSFKKKLKMKAVREDTDVLDLTRRLADCKDLDDELKLKKINKNFRRII